MIKYQCGEVCGSHGCNQAMSCPIRAQHYKPEQTQSLSAKIGRFVLAAALIVIWAYLIAEWATK